MVKSMTAFGRSRFTLEGKSYILEIHSVNRKGLEISLNIPSDLAAIEMFLRKELKKVCLRGQLTCKILSDSSQNQKISPIAMKRIYDKLTDIAKELDPNYKITFSDVLEVALKSPVALDSNEKEVEGILKKALDDAKDDFIGMREKEGAALKEDILDRLIQVEKTCTQILKKSENAPQKLKEKILNRLNEANLIDDESQERVMRELIIYADKCDITEEITRTRSHIKQMESLLTGDSNKKDHSIGRTLEFLLQELLREMNTTSAKSQDLEIITEVIFIKREIEKIREQVQNIE